MTVLHTQNWRTTNIHTLESVSDRSEENLSLSCGYVLWLTGDLDQLSMTELQRMLTQLRRL